MSLDKPPPSRYRVEEKDGRLIVHDSRSDNVLGNQFAKQPVARTGSALNAAERPVSPAPQRASPAPSAPASSFKGPADQEKAKRGAIVAIAGIALVLFAIFTGLWIAIIVVVIVPQLRQAVIGRILPAIKRYIEDGRFG